MLSDLTTKEEELEDNSEFIDSMIMFHSVVWQILSVFTLCHDRNMSWGRTRVEFQTVCSSVVQDSRSNKFIYICFFLEKVNKELGQEVEKLSRKLERLKEEAFNASASSTPRKDMIEEVRKRFVTFSDITQCCFKSFLPLLFSGLEK